MVTAIKPKMFPLALLSLLSPRVSPSPVGSVYQVLSQIDRSNPQGPHFLSFKPFHLYGQLPTSQFFSSNKKELQILQPSEQQYSKLRNVFTNPTQQTPDSFSTNSIVKNRVQPQNFQKVTFNSLDEDLELDFGRNFKYELHPEEKLSLSFLD